MEHSYYMPISLEDAEKIKEGTFQFNESHEDCTMFGDRIRLYEHEKDAKIFNQPVAYVTLNNKPKEIKYSEDEEFVDKALEKCNKNNVKAIGLYEPATDDTQIIVLDNKCVKRITVEPNK